MITGNKGEWSEVYTLFKLAAEGILYAADAEANRIEELYYDVLKITRKEKGNIFNYIRNGDVQIVTINNGIENEIAKIPISEFKENAYKLLSAIQRDDQESRAFAIPEINDFLDKIKCGTTKAKSDDKADIILKVQDIRAGNKPELGFSIKSQVGSAATLFNASVATNFVYDITGANISEIEKTKVKNIQKYKIKFEYMEQDLGANISFRCVENDIFSNNLSLIDTRMKEILANMLYNYYHGKATTVKALTQLCIEDNICNVPETIKETFYPHKIKEFLTAVALGMVPASQWNGKYDATGGYIIVKSDGDIVCYHSYNHNEFRDYLYNNTKFDTPSAGKHKFGIIEDDGDRQIIKLNLQVRFIK